MAPRRRMGRPPTFRARARLTVFLEARDRRRLRRAARAARLSVSAFARRILLAALPPDGRS